MMSNGVFILPDSVMNLIKTFVYIFEIVTMVYSINIILFMKKVFVFAKRPEYERITPLYNIFCLLKIIKEPTYYGLLFFIPFANLIYIISLNKKLCKFFDKNPDFLWGMTFAPFIYIPKLVSPKEKSKEEQKKSEPVKKYSMKDRDKNLLTDLELANLNKEKVEKEEVDSIFKADIDEIESASPYKAGKQKIKIVEEEAPYERETIKKVEAVKAVDIQKERKYVIDEDTNE